MMKILERLLGKIFGEPVATKPKSNARLKRSNHAGDFRAVEIAPSLLCCQSAKQVSGKRFLLRKAPRVPLMGCTMPTTCSCVFRKSADRRDGDRRLLGAGTSRWFAGADSRKLEGRRLAER